MKHAVVSADGVGAHDHVTGWGTGCGGRCNNDIACASWMDLSYGMADKWVCSGVRLCAVLLLLAGCPASDSSKASDARHDHSGVTLDEACDSSCAASAALNCSDDLSLGECESACKSQPMTQTRACEHQAWIDVNDCMSKSTLFCDQSHHAAVKVEDCGAEIEALGNCLKPGQNSDAGADGAAGRQGAGVAGRGGAGGIGGGAGGAGVKLQVGGSGGGAGASGWFCTMVQSACVCVPVPAGSATATCVPPEPSCCIETLSNGEVKGCQCWPEGSGVCSLPMSSPASYRSSETCPPK